MVCRGETFQACPQCNAVGYAADTVKHVPNCNGTPSPQKKKARNQRQKVSSVRRGPAGIPFRSCSHELGAVCDSLPQLPPKSAASKETKFGTSRKRISRSNWSHISRQFALVLMPRRLVCLSKRPSP